MAKNDWFRSWHGAPTDPKWRTIAKRAGVKASVVVALVWTFMDRASQAEERGSFAGYDEETLADFLDCEPEQVRAVVDALNEKGVASDDVFCAWRKHQPTREDASGPRRQAEWRDRQKGATEPTPDQPEIVMDSAPPAKTEAPAPVAKVRKERAKPKTAMEEGAQPTQADRKYAMETIGMSEPLFRTEWAKFRAHHIGHGNLMSNWHQAWTKWAINVQQYQPRNVGSISAPKRNEAIAAGEELLRELDERYANNSTANAITPTYLSDGLRDHFPLLGGPDVGKRQSIHDREVAVAE